MKRLFKKICAGAGITAVFSVLGAVSVMAGTAAEYTYDSSTGYISSVDNPDEADYAYVSPGVKKLTVSTSSSPASDYYISFSEDTTSGGVTYYHTYSSYTGRYLKGVFRNCGGLKRIVIEDGVTELPYGCFFALTGVEELVFPQNELSFETQPDTSTSIKIGSYRYFYSPTFGYMTGLETYYCASGYEVSLPYGSMETYDYTDGQLLYKLSGETYEVLRCLPGAEEVVIPDNIDGVEVASIGDKAFYGCDLIKSVTVPNTVKTIGDEAFSGCSSLETIAISASVTAIGESCFYGCPAMTVTCGKGTAADNSSLYSEGTVFVYTDRILGDINYDGRVNAADAVLALRYALGDFELSEVQLEAGDVNGDGSVDSADVERIVKFDTGEISGF